MNMWSDGYQKIKNKSMLNDGEAANIEFDMNFQKVYTELVYLLKNNHHWEYV